MRSSSFLFLIAIAAALGGCHATKSATPARTPLAIVATSPTEALPAASDLLTLDTAPGNRFVRADQRGEAVIRVRINGQKLHDARRPPVNLGLVVDTSGSMEGDAIRDARAASLALLESLSEGDRLSIVTFDSHAEVLVPATRLDKETIVKMRERIGTMKAQGTTDLAGGLRAALAQVLSGFQANGVNRIVLLGDGVPNDEPSVLPIAKQAAASMVPVTVLGLGVDYNETLMNQIAQQSGGKYHFVRDSSAVATVFKDELVRVKRVVARNTHLRLRPGPGVTIDEVVGVPASASGADVDVALGDVSEGDQRDVIVRLSVSGRRAGSLVEIVDAEVSFDRVSVGGRLTAQKFVGARASADTKEIAAAIDNDVQRAAAHARVASKIVRAIALARAGSLGEARTLLDDAERDARAAAKLYDDATLEEKAKAIPSLRKELATLVPPPAPIAAPAPGGYPRPMPVPTKSPSPQIYESQAAAVSTLQGM